MNNSDKLLHVIANILLEVNLPEEKKQLIRDAMKSDTPAIKKFIAPTIEEVFNLFIELNVNESMKHAQEFVYFYDSKGWMVGKNKMKVWKSAAGRWAMNLPKGQNKPLIV
jgi:hypothetical protein